MSRISFDDWLACGYDPNVCAYCGVPATVGEHVWTSRSGGPDCVTNLVPWCAPCNASKGSLSLFEFLDRRRLSGRLLPFSDVLGQRLRLHAAGLSILGRVSRVVPLYRCG